MSTASPVVFRHNRASSIHNTNHYTMFPPSRLVAPQSTIFTDPFTSPLALPIICTRGSADQQGGANRASRKLAQSAAEKRSGSGRAHWPSCANEGARLDLLEELVSVEDGPEHHVAAVQMGSPRRGDEELADTHGHSRIGAAQGCDTEWSVRCRSAAR